LLGTRTSGTRRRGDGDGVWNTTADDIAEYYIANHYDEVTSWIAAQKAQT
jgi:hypothetical protein